MSLSNDKVAKIPGKESSSIVSKIHNMPWLKQATPSKNSDLGERTNGKMFNALTLVNDNNQAVSEKKHRKGRAGKKRKQNAVDISKNIDMKYTTAQGQSGAGNSAWSTDKNVAESLFPNAGESAAINQLSEEEQMEIVLAESIETAYLEKCAADPPNVVDDTDGADERSDEDNFWDGVHHNLPSPPSEESVKISDRNNNAGAIKKTITSSVAIKPVPCTVASSKESKRLEIEPGSKAEKLGAIPLDVPITPAIVPKFIDRFGRPDGRNEQHLFMGKGGRKKEEEYRKNQHGIVNDSSVTKSCSVSSQDETPSTNTEEVKDNARINDSESFNKANERSRSISDSQDSRHETNAVAVDKSSQDDNSGAANKSNDKQSFNTRVQDSYRPKSVSNSEDDSRNDIHRTADKSNEKNRPDVGFQNSQRPTSVSRSRDNLRNDIHKPADKSNENNRPKVGSQDSQRPTSVLKSRDNLRNDNHRPADRSYDKSYEKNRPNSDVHDTHRSKNSSEKNVHNDRSQKGTYNRVKPDLRYRYNDPFNASGNPFNASGNPFKYSKESNDGNYENRDKVKSHKTDAERDSRSTTREFRDNNAEKKIPALFSTKVDPPPDYATVAKELEEPIVEKSSSSLKDPKPDYCQMETKKSSADLPKPNVQITDFNSRFSSSQELISLPTYPTSACSSTKSFFNDRYNENIGDCCQKNEPQLLYPQSLSAPPPGFQYLEPAQHSCTSAAYVLPVDPTLTSSAYTPVEVSRTACAHVPSQERRRKIFSDDAVLEAIYVRIKMYDPNLYNFLLQKEQQLQRLENEKNIVRAAAYAKIPETCSEISVSPRPYEEQPQSFVDDDYEIEQRAPTAMPINRNAIQYSPPPTQAESAMLSCYSAAPNFDLQPAIPFCPSVPPPQTVRRPQDISAWTTAAGTNPYFSLEPQAPPQYQQIHRHHQHHRNFSNANCDSPTPTAILGRQNYLVSLQNESYQNAQRPMNLQLLNDDYPRCQSSSFENIPNDMQRQVPYQALPPACGVVPNQSLTHSAMCGTLNRPGTNRCGCSSQSTKPLQSYAAFAMTFNRTQLDAKPENDSTRIPESSQGWSNYDANYNNQSQHQFVQPIIRQNSFNEIQQLPSQGRGRARLAK